ncbi:hypothetical protein FLL45_22315 [Aliikangiella marina]|uniref:Uncharacterized protein n=1 Tax=Aliikangiella marina TaxID=1712262 RepID=A0A545T1G8_9GAMM|nr:hypothetical protein [Aliikangiella marina]TQV71064.1 hypothetical protein FLL45_22315 [Aliikangiella marina]
MNRIKAKKMVKKVLRMLFLAGMAVYLGFIWYVNRSVDQFFDRMSNNFDIEYGRAWADLSGNLYISEIEFYEEGEYPVVTVGSLHADFDSTSNLIDLSEYAAYQVFPPKLNLTVEAVQTSDTFMLFSRLKKLNLPFNTEIIPDACKNILTQTPAAVGFNGEAEFKYDYNNRQFLFDINVDTIALADLNVKGLISDIENEIFMSGFLEQIEFQINDFVWLQQALNRCRETTGQSEIGQLARTFVSQLNQVANDNHYVLSNNLVNQYRDFINLPERISLAFSPAIDQSWQSIQKLPLHEITQKSTITLGLNQSEVDKLIASVDYLGFERDRKTQEEESTPVATTSYLPVNYQGLRRFIGSQVILHFKNRKQVGGEIARLTPKRIFLSEYKFGGRSVLPYNFTDISFIELDNGNR